MRDEGAPTFGLGIDAGGTATRWALADADGQILAEGRVAGIHGRVASQDDRLRVERNLFELADAARVHAVPTHLVAGISGYDAGAAGGHLFLDTFARALGLAPERMAVCNDIVLSYLAALEPGAGYLVYAGTGSMSVFIDTNGLLHRAGGRGIVLDDAGSGFWIAREALRSVWRQEELEPQSWRRSPLARRLFDVIGGADWTATRQFVYTKGRGEVGKLALQVAASHDDDRQAREILVRAGRELARLARVPLTRHGSRPVVRAGGVFALHPSIAESMAQAIGKGVSLRTQVLHSHRAAALSAAKGLPGLARVRRIREEGGATG